MYDINKVIENAEKKGLLISPENIDVWKDEKERRYSVEGEVDLELTSNIIYGICKHNKEDEDIEISKRKPIKIYINSHGGLLHCTMGLIDIMQLSKTPIITICEGEAYSSAGLILMAGHKRYSVKSGSFLLHSGSNGAVGTTDKVYDSVSFDKEYEKQIKDKVLSFTKIDSKKYDDNYRVDWFMDTDAMLKYGIIDEVLSEIIF